jgi:hypothetical protein
LLDAALCRTRSVSACIVLSMPSPNFLCDPYNQVDMPVQVARIFIASSTQI